MRLLFLGESAGNARYLTGTFARAQIAVRHVEARARLERLDEPFDVVFFSDFPAKHLGATATDSIVGAVERGAGLVMVGGWTSFTGQGDGYRDTPIARLLPVVCAASDDRRNVPSGLWFGATEPSHPIFSGLDLGSPPVICGYNAVELAPDATLLVQGRLAAFHEGQLTPGATVPLLAVRHAGSGRAVAYMSDLLPHWCGGVVDWGTDQHEGGRIPLPSGAEVGHCYVTFLLNMLRWAAGEQTGTS